MRISTDEVPADEELHSGKILIFRSMHKGRLEAFSDGVLAIIITIMVLEMKVPHGTDLASLQPLLPVFLSYVLSFAYIGIYWNNHHHLFRAVKHVSGKVLFGEFAPAFLPFFIAICDRMDGRKPFQSHHRWTLWLRAAHGGHRIPDFGQHSHFHTRYRLDPRDCHGRQPKGNRVDIHLRHRHGPDLVEQLAIHSAVHRGWLSCG